MTKTIKIKGIKCPHCEAKIKQALEGLDGITEATVSKETGLAIATLEKDVDNEIITKVIEDAGFKVKDIK